MHADEVHSDAELVRRLLRAQFPQWAALPIERVASSGTDNALYRLGEEMIVRLPRIRWAAKHADKEYEWLPRLAPQLPLVVPAPIAKGAPGEDYPWSWTVCRWLDGEPPAVGRIADAAALATDLARFVKALQGIDATGGPRSGARNSFRGAPLEARDAPARAALAALDGLIDVEAATAMWNEALATPAWNGAPVWVHGDLSPGNLLCVDGRLRAVIDFGCLGVGDPAVDLIVAWNLFPAEARAVYRDALGVDEATWARGRGWALSVALIQLPYYKDTNPSLAENSRYVIGEILSCDLPQIPR